MAWHVVLQLTVASSRLQRCDDGQIDTKDAAIIMQFVAGLITSLG